MVDAPIALRMLADPTDSPGARQTHTVALLFAASQAFTAAILAVGSWLTGHTAWAWIALAPLVGAGLLVGRASGRLATDWARSALPLARLERQICTLMLEHQDVWTGYGHGGVPCTAQWRWKRDGLWLEKCVVLGPPGAHATGHPHIPLRPGRALIPHQVGPWGVCNRLFAATGAHHAGLLVVEWRSAHQKMASLTRLRAIADGARSAPSSAADTRDSPPLDVTP